VLLNEFFEPEKNSFQDVSDDNSSPKFGELRKTRLFLKEINKIRKMREVQSYEKANDLKKIRQQYKPASGEGGMPQI
jgi:hypothetical protein